MSRHQSRVGAFQALYAWALSGESLPFDPDFSWVESPQDTSYSKCLVAGCLERISEIDGMIKNHLQNYELSRLGKIELSIMRLGVYELLFSSDIDPAVCIHEAVRIAEDFGSSVSFKIVNGVLDAVKLSMQKKQSEQQ